MFYLHVSLTEMPGYWFILFLKAGPIFNLLDADLFWGILGCLGDLSKN